ncbi:zinc finger 862-like [Paramuricea clavata]|uniref:Zinc finger 862-like n=1 Tax=Paramuricea clavata TaxID=317549 RepID=A0A6S7JS30_PARCT|nr:zinc finger 862-like [Paramuricea clavata]
MRKFNPSWQHIFPWVKLVSKKMFCDVCMNNQHADKTSTFVKGSDNFHVKSLCKHVLSKGHIKCVANAKARSAPPGTNPAKKALQVLHETEFEKMYVLFRVSHSSARKEDHFQTTNAEHLNLASELSAAPSHSVMTDGTTDLSVCEAEMFVRYCNKGKLSNRFLALRNLDRANAENIAKVVEDSLTKVGGIPDEDLYNKVVGYSADGASVNMGCHSDVELAFKDILKKCENQLQVVNFLNNIYTFYHTSSLNRSMLRVSSVALGMKGIPTRVGSTRWIPHTYTAVQNMWSLYPALLQHFGELQVNPHSADGSAKAQGFLCLMKKPGPKLMELLNDGKHHDLNLEEDNNSTFERFIPIVNDLLETLKSIFTAAGNIEHLNWIGFLNLRSWPVKDWSDFADEQITMLLNHYKPYLTPACPDHVEDVVAESLVEWDGLKSTIYRRCIGSAKSLNWEQINNEFCETAGVFLLLVDLLLSIPAHSVECERGFSLLKVIKPDW